MDFVKRSIAKDFGFEVNNETYEEAVDLEKTMNRLRLCARPISPDDFFIQGPMRHYPNVILNVGFGAHGFRAIPAGLILKSLIDASGEAEAIFEDDVMKRIDTKRMFI